VSLRSRGIELRKEHSQTSGDDPSPLWSCGEVRRRLLIEPVQERAELRQIKYFGIEKDDPLIPGAY